MSATTTQLLSSGEFCKLRYTLYLLKVHLQTFLSLPVTQRRQILSCDTLVANERCIITPENHKEGTWNKREELHPTDGM